MRRGLATLPVSLEKSSAYLASNVSHGIWSASLIQRLSEFMWRPKGWLKSRKECCSLSIGLYIVLAPRMLKICKNCKKDDLFSSKSLQSLYQKMGQKSVKSSVCGLISRHYVGIDIAKLNHFATAISSDGEILLEPFKFTNDAPGRFDD